MLNSSINATRTQDCIIIGGQQFRVEPAILANFTKLDLLFSPDFVFRYDNSTQDKQFMSYAVAQDLMAILSSDHTSLSGYSATQLVNVCYLANYLGLTDWFILESVLVQIKRMASFKLVRKLQSLPSLNIPLAVVVYLKNYVVQGPAVAYGGIWNNSAEKFCANFYDELTDANYVRFYTKQGAPLGAKIQHGATAFWFDDDSYVIVFIQGHPRALSIQFYNPQGVAVGPLITDVQCVHGLDRNTQVLLVRNKLMQRVAYNQLGQQVIVDLLPVSTALPERCGIKCGCRDGVEKCKYSDRSPDYQYYLWWVKFELGWSGKLYKRALAQIYDHNDLPVSGLIKELVHFEWGKTSTIGFAWFHNDLAGVYYQQENFNHLNLMQQVLIQALLNDFVNRHHGKVLNNYMCKLLPNTLVFKLQDNQLLGTTKLRLKNL